MSEFFEYQNIVQNVISLFAFAIPLVITYKGKVIPRGKTEDIHITHDSNLNHRTIHRLESNAHNDNGNVTTWLDEYHPLFDWRQKGKKHFQRIKVGHAPFILKDGTEAKAIEK